MCVCVRVCLFSRQGCKIFHRTRTYIFDGILMGLTNLFFTSSSSKFVGYFASTDHFGMCLCCCISSLFLCLTLLCFQIFVFNLGDGFEKKNTHLMCVCVRNTHKYFTTNSFKWYWDVIVVGLWFGRFSLFNSFMSECFFFLSVVVAGLVLIERFIIIERVVCVACMYLFAAYHCQKTVTCEFLNPQRHNGRMT